jgi:hypothetical protein
MPGSMPFQAMLADLGRSGALIISAVDGRDNRINQLNGLSPGGSHDIAFGRGPTWAHWLTLAW